MSEIAICTENLEHTYPNGNVHALRGVNLDINVGDIVSIIGQNGSGKTTLVRHFNGLLRPTKGKVLLFGEDSKNKSIALMSQRCGYVFQNPNHQIFCTTVREELEVAPKYFKFSAEKTKKNIEAVIELMQLESILDIHPMTLDYTTKKILTIASVMAFKPEVLILDEPTGGLDEVGRQMLTKVLHMMHNEGHTVIIISHDMDYVAENSTRVVMMAQGQIQDDASPQKIFLNKEKLELSQIEPPQITSLDFALSGRTEKATLSVEEFLNKYKKGE